MTFGRFHLPALTKLGNPFFHFGMADMQAGLPIMLVRGDTFPTYGFTLFFAFHKGGNCLNNKRIGGTLTGGGKTLYPLF